jgi:hypothetical protein
MNDETAYEEVEEEAEGRSVWRVVDLARMVAGGAAGATVVVASSSIARADAPCARVVASDGLGPAWAGALDELRKQIALLPAADCQPMTLTVEPSGGAARVVAVTADGRRAERPVLRVDSLVPTALGLLMAIPKEVPPPQPQPPLPAQAPLPPPARATEATPVSPSPKNVAWAGLSGGLRLTAPTDVTVFDVEARADLLLGQWLALATIRSAVASCTGKQGVDCDVYTDVSIGAGVGRRLRAGAAAVDVAFEPSVVWMHMEYDAPTGEGLDAQGSEVVLRVDASARLAVPLGDSWALTLTLDAGLAPTLLASPTRIALPTGAPASEAPPLFPAWTGGLRLGASGALP